MQLTPWVRSRSHPVAIARDLLGFDPFGPARAPAVRVAEFAPQFDIKETENAFVVHADVPGVEREVVEIELHEGVLTIRGTRQETREESGETYHVAERRHGAFRRAFRLPDHVDPERIEAQLSSGVLQVTVPKKAEPRPRKITVKTSDPDV